MIKIIGVSIVSAVLYIVVKKYSPEYSILIEAAAILLILWSVYPYLCDIIDFFSEYSCSVSINAEYMKIVIKALGIAVLTQFAADICKDSGENALASKVEFAGKLLVTAMSLPIAKAILELAAGIINKQ